MIYLELFLTFLQIGAFSFGGGYGMISLIREKVLTYGWLAEEEMLNMIAVAESTPGPIAVNMATFVGSSQGGFLGALLATLGVVLPSFIIILVIAALEDGTVSKSTIADLLDKTSDIELYEDENLVDVIPVKYVIDEAESVNDPYGLEAQTLRVEADIITANADAVDKITACIKEAGLEVDGFIPSSAAMMGLIPDYDEDENSTLLIDVGGSNTEFIVYSNTYPFFASSIPVGGDHITNDIAAVLNISPEEAETIKRDYAIAAAELVTNNVDVAVFNIEKGMQELVKIKDIVEIMEARIVALLNIIADKLEREDISSAGISRVIFCGDGLNSFNGLDTLCEEIFESKYVKVDFTRATGMKSCYTYSGGMVMYISKLLPLGRVDSKIEKRSYAAEQTGGQSKTKIVSDAISGVKDKVKGFVARFKE